MNPNLRIVKSACLAALGIGIAIAAAACSSDDNNSSPTVDSGSPGNPDATMMMTTPDGSMTTSPDGGAVTCEPDAGIGGSDTHNTCSTWGCAGFYDNAAHMVPSPLPTL